MYGLGWIWGGFLQFCFVDLVGPLSRRPGNAGRLTEDGIHLTPEGLEFVGGIVAQQLGVAEFENSSLGVLKSIIAAKNRIWFDAWRPANWSFAYGDRVSQLFGKGRIILKFIVRELSRFEIILGR